MNGVKATILTLSVLALGISSSCGHINSQVNNNEGDKAVENPDQQFKSALISKLREENIKTYGEWDVGESSPLVYLVRRNENKNIFTIIDPSGKILYEKSVGEINKVYKVWSLRIPEPQLVLEYSEGGSDSFVQMLNYNEGNISEIIDSTNGENSFGSDIKIQPQFRSGINPAKEPFEILLTDYGIASSAGKFTRVLRYKNNKYRYFGQFDREKVGNYKESIISR